ncbi:SMI1/KNR4 family protein [Streptomyces sp. NPDC058045]|uniref:SMI1/KNR4 family protein n=1 Tax=Streptomyces sp. NPDC058045 TaxID=3346311 RepID=UPI0036EE49D2
MSELNAAQREYLTGLLGDLAPRVIEDLPPDFGAAPLTEDQIAECERRGGAQLPDELREFLRVLGGAGVVTPEEFRPFHTTLGRVWDKLSEGPGTWWEMSDDFVADYWSRAEAQAAYDELNAGLKHTYEIATERGILIDFRTDETDEVEEEGAIVLDPATGEVYVFPSPDRDSPNCMRLAGTFREWAAEDLGWPYL